MTRSKLLTVCILLLAVCGVLWGYIGLKEEAQNLQKTIDTQKELIYNKDNQIAEMTKMISGQEKELIKAYDKIKELEEEKQQSNTMQVKITHYSSEETGSTMTASGRHAQVGRTIACNFLPLGTRVLINGQEYVVDDRGNLDMGIVDIYVSSKDEAIRRGVYYTTMEVLNG